MPDSASIAEDGPESILAPNMGLHVPEINARFASALEAAAARRRADRAVPSTLAMEG